MSKTPPGGTLGRLGLSDQSTVAQPERGWSLEQVMSDRLASRSLRTSLMPSVELRSWGSWGVAASTSWKPGWPKASAAGRSNSPLNNIRVGREVPGPSVVGSCWTVSEVDGLSCGSEVSLAASPQATPTIKPAARKGPIASRASWDLLAGIANPGVIGQASAFPVALRRASRKLYHHNPLRPFIAVLTGRNKTQRVAML